MADVAAPSRALPHDIQAEMGVLGSMLLSPEAILLARERLGNESFYKLAHQEIFASLLDVADAHDTADIILLRDELKRRDKLEQVGGTRYLQELMEAVPTSANAEYYIEIVREHAVRRQLIDTATRVLKAAYEPGREVEGLLDDAESTILAVRNMRQAGQLKPMSDLLKHIIAHADRVHQNPGLLTGLATGFMDMDDITCGLQPGELVVVAARPSVGKTTLALNILHHVCMVERRPAVLYTLEVRAEQIVSNFLCLHDRLDTMEFRRGTLKDSQWRDIHDSIDDLVGLPLHVDDSPSLRLGDLRARARRMRHQHGVELVVVDYLQLVRPDRARDNRPAEVAEVSAGLKALARELDVPVIAVAQLNRSVETESRRPRMSDLRESGAIEQDADVIMLLHRPDYAQDKDQDAGEQQARGPKDAAGIPGAYADVIVAKQRNGPTGVCPLVFWKRFLRFESRSTTTM